MEDVCMQDGEYKFTPSITINFKSIYVYIYYAQWDMTKNTSKNNMSVQKATIPLALISVFEE